MRLDYASFTHPGGQPTNKDAAHLENSDDRLVAIVNDAFFAIDSDSGDMKCATVEESRVYVFTGGELRACLDGEETAQLSPGDAALVCSDGFWNYVFDFEMHNDLLKATSADGWLRLMLLRLVQRSYLDGDNVSVIACRVVA
jgi:hypothetical protein